MHALCILFFRSPDLYQVPGDILFIHAIQTALNQSHLKPTLISSDDNSYGLGNVLWEEYFLWRGVA